MIRLVPAGDKRRYALAAADAAVVAAAAVGAFGIRFFSTKALDYVGEYWWLVPLSVVVCLGSFRVFGLLRMGLVLYGAQRGCGPG
ncbi:MAG: hypothetical protein V3T71_04520 [Dehalococcoidia bacterium]